MPVAKVTSKGQVTMPKSVRELLRVNTGDRVVFDPAGNDTVVLRKAQPFDRAWHEALENTLTEWASPEDDEAFGDL